MLKLNEKTGLLMICMYIYNPEKKGGKKIESHTVISELQLGLVQIHACLGLSPDLSTKLDCAKMIRNCLMKSILSGL